MEYFSRQGLYWALINLGKVNQWFKCDNLKVFLGLLCELLYCCLFLFIT